jgi:hypothetical protein
MEKEDKSVRATKLHKKANKKDKENKKHQNLFLKKPKNIWTQ